MPKRYRKRPVEVDAAYLKPDNADRIAEWCGGWTEERQGQPGPVVMIKTLEGTMRADQGDYVIKGVQGEFYPCKPDIFEQTYEAV
jgi:hypothetical protein